MGFRNPVTSISDVNTGDPLSGAGVHVYETTDSNGYPYGLVEFSDGVTGDVSAKVIGKANYNPRAQAQTLGGGLYLTGGSYNPNGAGLIAAPELDLEVLQLPDSSFASVATLKNAARLQVPALTDLSGNDLFNGGSTGVLAGTAAPAGTKLIRKTYVNPALAGNASGDNTITFPGGPFAHGLVDLQVTSFPNGLSAAAQGYTWQPWGPTVAGVNVRCFAGMTVTPNGSLGISVTATGW